MSVGAVPVGGRILTKPFKALAAVAAVGFAVIALRFAVGLGATTAMNDGYAWGLWIAYDVVTGTAFACGGYALALLVYIMNRGRYHPLVRSAILTSAMGYSIAGFSVMLDIGRWWGAWKVPFFVWRWNPNSVLLEVALCIMAYVVVVWIELSPAFFERGRTAALPWVRRLSERALVILDRGLIWIVALGFLLPTMHQSSLGSLMLIAGPRLHPLWQTPFLPLLFLISCLGMGFGAVIVESSMASRFFGRRPHTQMLAGLAAIVVPILLAFAAIRFGDLMARGALPLLFAFDLRSVLALLEFGLVVVAGAMLVTRTARHRAGTQFRAAMLLLAAGALYRFDTYLVAFQPGPQWSYFPSLGEIVVTVGLVAFEVLVYLVLVKQFPILGAQPAPPQRPRPSGIARVERAGVTG
ncbi:MAG TPA: Ni/Fe-hydrogenase cytochrome b subunit [Vicinamibacterales bacterium]|jgi:Ni/Fe-hydrogenase subunit HybB-like protein|nr:Ni/Fe-hydrogenase cytochrome b subunit [Vicinamibacterales bacterium]